MLWLLVLSITVLVLLGVGLYLWFACDIDTYNGPYRTREAIKKLQPCGEAEVPKILHQVWIPIGKNTIPDHHKKYAEKTRQLHPDWQYIMHDGEPHCRELVAKVFPDLLPTWDAFTHEMFRIDTIQYVLMFSQGGVYFDGDMYANENLEPYLKAGYATFGYQRKNIHRENAVCGAFMASPPGHPFFLFCLKNLIGAPSKGNPVNVAGPNFLTKMLRKYKGKDTVIYPMPIIYPWPYSWTITENTPMPKEAITATVFDGNW